MSIADPTSKELAEVFFPGCRDLTKEEKKQKGQFECIACKAVLSVSLKDGS
jgi:hypothetical protein